MLFVNRPEQGRAQERLLCSMRRTKKSKRPVNNRSSCFLNHIIIPNPKRQCRFDKSNNSRASENSARQRLHALKRKSPEDMEEGDEDDERRDEEPCTDSAFKKSKTLTIAEDILLDGFANRLRVRSPRSERAIPDVLRERNDASILTKTGRVHVLEKVFNEETETAFCDKCGAMLSTSRLSVHQAFWCEGTEPVGESGEDADDERAPSPPDLEDEQGLLMDGGIFASTDQHRIAGGHPTRHHPLLNGGSNP